MLPPPGAHAPASRILLISSFGTGSGFNRRIEQVVRMISNRSYAFRTASGITTPVNLSAEGGMFPAERRVASLSTAIWPNGIDQYVC
jgi:hypothetical protein